MTCTRRRGGAWLLLAVAALGMLLAAATANAAGVDPRGTWDVKGPGIPDQPWTVSTYNASTGAITGKGGPTNGYTWPITGTVQGDAITMRGTYDQLPSYTATLTGTFTGSGAGITGRWSSNAGQGGTFTATRRGAVPPPTTTPTTPTTPSGGLRRTAVRVTCNRGPDQTSDSVCTAEVGDGGPAPQITPSGTVRWTVTGQGTMLTPTCTLTPTPLTTGVAYCSATFRPGPAGTPAGTVIPLTAAYEGNARFASSSGVHKLLNVKPKPGVLNGQILTLPIECLGIPGCTGKVTVQSAAPSGGQGSGETAAPVVYARGSFRIRGNATGRVRMRLTAAGRTRARSARRITAFAVMTLAGSGARQVSRITIRR